MSQNAKVSELARRNIPEQYREQYERLLAKPTRSLAIKIKCLECVNWQREEVKRCTAPLCPLFALRPGIKHEPTRAAPKHGFKKGGAR